MNCVQEYDAVESYLDKEKMRKEGAVRQNSNYGVVCNGCYEEYKLKHIRDDSCKPGGEADEDMIPPLAEFNNCLFWATPKFNE